MAGRIVSRRPVTELRIARLSGFTICLARIPHGRLSKSEGDPDRRWTQANRQEHRKEELMRHAHIALAVVLTALVALPLCQATAAEDGVVAATPREGVIEEGYKGVSLQDRTEILDLIYRYSHTVDAGDLDGFVSLFVEDCRWIAKLPKETILLDSREKLRGHVARRLQYFVDNGIQTRHLQMNTILTRIGYDRVQGVTYVTLLGQVKGESAPRLISTGIYKDEFVQTEEGWRFAVREATLDQGRLPSVQK